MHKSQPGKSHGIPKITRTEAKVLDYMGQGFSAGRIADTMIISRRTVEWHQKNLYWKFGVNSALMLVSEAHRFGLMSEVN